jgi:hypothetical protein
MVQPETAADESTLLRSHGDEALVEEAMEFGTQKKSVADYEKANQRLGHYVARLQRRQRVLTACRARPAVRFGARYAKCPLSQPRRHEAALL